MAEGYRFCYFMICDDVRNEVTGKEILIGLYNDVIITKDTVALFSTLFFRIAVMLERDNFRNIHFVIKNEQDQKFFEVNGEIRVQSTKQKTIFNLGSGPAAIPIGKYSVWLGIDSVPELVDRFIVRFPETEEEGKRVPSRN